MMSWGEEKPKWNVFQDIKNAAIAPEALMAEINSAISALEYARSAALDVSQSRPPPHPPVSKPKPKTFNLPI